MSKGVLVLFVLALLATTAFAEWSEILRVVVNDLNGYPVANEMVTVKYQKNLFLRTETVDEISTVLRTYERPGTSAYVTGVVIDPVTGIATVTYDIEDPSTVSGTAVVPVVDDYFEENLEISDISVTITRPDLSDADGEITGYTGPDGTFETLVRNFVPKANETRDYLVKVGGEERRVKYQQNIIGGRHVEFFKTSDSLNKLEVTVLDFKDEPLPEAVLFASCWTGNNVTVGASGMVTIYLKGTSCKLTVTYGVYETKESVRVEAEKIVLLRIVKDGLVFNITALDSRERAVSGESITVQMAGRELEFSEGGTAQMPEGIVYGALVETVVSYEGYSLSKWLYLYNGTARMAIPTNEMRTIKVENYNNTLTVIVVDENGAPFDNAHVVLPDRSAITPPNGAAEFDEIYSADVNVTVVVMGLNKSQIVEFVGGEATATFEFRRNPLRVTLQAINHTYDQGCKVLLAGRVDDPRVGRAADNTVQLTYNFEGETESSKKLLVDADGVTVQTAIPCPEELPATLIYSFEASNQYANATSEVMSYVVPAPPPITSLNDVFDESVDIVEQFTGSESSALIIVTLVLLVFIVGVSVVALTALVHRRKLKKIMGKEDREGKPPKGLEI